MPPKNGSMLGCIAEMWRVGSKLFLKEFLLHTLPETNTAFENRPSQNETSIPAIHFQVHFFFCVSFGSLVRSGLRSALVALMMIPISVMTTMEMKQV